MKRMWSKNEVKNLTKEVIESGQVENAKPIYYHPCYIFNNVEAGKTFRIQLAIINNKATPFTKTTLLAEIKRLCDLGAIINCNGTIQGVGDEFNNAYIIYFSSPNYILLANSTTSIGNGYSIETLFGYTDTQVLDGVNKIN